MDILHQIEKNITALKLLPPLPLIAESLRLLELAKIEVQSRSR